MLSLRPTSSIVFFGVLAGIAAAEQSEAPLQGGSYEVTYRLELLHVESWAIDKTTTICVPDAQGSSPVALPILSGNNPFQKCSAENFRRDGANLTYNIVCEGRDSAKARAAYTVAPGEFKGRIAMVMGGKNMTMTEVQVGRRVGSCDLATASRD
jgi:hypothetical protein